MDTSLQQRVARIESLIEEMKAATDPKTGAAAIEVVQTLMELHYSGLDRIMEVITDSDEAGKIMNKFAEDEMVSSLLLLHGLHPVDLEDRVMAALDSVRPYLHSHGGNVELVEISNGTVRLRMIGSCNGCPSSAMTLKLAIEKAIYEAAPDVASIEAA